MNIVQTWQTTSTSLEETLQLGEAIGRRLKGGEVILLVSDLGGGKTMFVKGLAAGMGITENVSSPSFAISNRYKAGALLLHHLDFYRLTEPGLLKDELLEITADKQNVVAVEWPNIIEDVLPSERLSIYIKLTGEDTRSFTFEYTDKQSYLFPANT